MHTVARQPMRLVGAPRSKSSVRYGLTCIRECMCAWRPPSHAEGHIESTLVTNFHSLQKVTCLTQASSPRGARCTRHCTQRHNCDRLIHTPCCARTQTAGALSKVSQVMNSRYRLHLSHWYQTTLLSIHCLLLTIHYQTAPLYSLLTQRRSYIQRSVAGRHVCAAFYE